jgi:hypothetical protein
MFLATNAGGAGKKHNARPCCTPQWLILAKILSEITSLLHQIFCG